jgi:uncharacterized protein YjbI with pentapeptide repeats
MANPEHLEKLKEGVKAWNQWREEDPDIKPDLSNADFKGVNLKSVNFSNSDLQRTCLLKADLSFADLSYANLSEADLSSAILFSADLQNSIIQGANLSSAVLENTFFLEVDLSAADLSFADLRDAELRYADLKSANLSSSNLSRADLSLANLQNVNLRNANLSEVNLKLANLRDADLSSTSLYFTNFTSADLTNTTLKNAIIYKTIFADLNLSHTEGLNSLNSEGNNIVDHQTIIQSKNLPQKFLIDCGLPDSFIENLPSALSSMEPIQSHSCFIIYSKKDEEFAKKLHVDLQAKSIRCWFAPENTKIGKKNRGGFHEGIHAYDKLLVILSKELINSDWAEGEIESALYHENKLNKKKEIRETMILPVRLDDAILKLISGWPLRIKRRRYIGDFTDWKNPDSYKTAFDRLLRDLKKFSE